MFINIVYIYIYIYIYIIYIYIYIYIHLTSINQNFFLPHVCKACAALEIPLQYRPARAHRQQKDTLVEFNSRFLLSARVEEVTYGSCVLQMYVCICTAIALRCVCHVAQRLCKMIVCQKEPHNQNPDTLKKIWACIPGRWCSFVSLQPDALAL